MKLTREQVDAVAESAETPADFVIGMYRFVHPDFDRVKKFLDFPRAGTELHKYTMRKAMDVDRAYVAREQKLGRLERLFIGGTWMNRGFSHDESLKSWEVVPAEVTYEEE